MAYGPLILGHAHPLVKNAIAARLGDGWLYGTPSPLEPEFAGMITADHPGMEMVRFVSSGSEATMAAIRLARGFTGKKDIVKIRRRVPRGPRWGAGQSRFRCHDHGGPRLGRRPCRPRRPYPAGAVQ